MGRGKSESTPKTLFAKRIKFLIGDEKHCDFEKNNLLSSGSVARIFGGAEPVRTTLEAIIKGTGCNASWLLTGDGEPFEKKGVIVMGENGFNAEPGSASEREATAQVDAIFRLQKALSEAQAILSEAGRHVVNGLSLKDYADLDLLINNLQSLESPMQFLTTRLKAYRRTHEGDALRENGIAHGNTA